jgi:hypothetical protein
MNGVVEAAISGATLAAAVAIWILVGYLIQRFAFRNPEPSHATILATSMALRCCCFLWALWRSLSDSDWLAHARRVAKHTGTLLIV